MRRIFLLCIRPLAVAAIFSIGSILQAQVANNTALVGAVVDQSGAPVSGAKVTAVNEGTQVTYPGATNADGYYSITFIAPWNLRHYRGAIRLYQTNEDRAHRGG